MWAGAACLGPSSDFVPSGRPDDATRNAHDVTRHNPLGLVRQRVVTGQNARIARGFFTSYVRIKLSFAAVAYKICHGQCSDSTLKRNSPEVSARRGIGHANPRPVRLDDAFLKKKPLPWSDSAFKLDNGNDRNPVFSVPVCLAVGCAIFPNQRSRKFSAFCQARAARKLGRPIVAPVFDQVIPAAANFAPAKIFRLRFWMLSFTHTQAPMAFQPRSSSRRPPARWN